MATGGVSIRDVIRDSGICRNMHTHELTIGNTEPDSNKTLKRSVATLEHTIYAHLAGHGPVAAVGLREIP